MSANWVELNTPAVQQLIDLLKNVGVATELAFSALEAFLDRATEEELYYLLVQIRLQLQGVVSEDETAVRRLDAIANKGSQSPRYLKGMQRAFTYLEKSKKELPTLSGD